MLSRHEDKLGLKKKPSSVSYEKSRIKQLLWVMLQEYQPVCPMCELPFVMSDVLPSRGVDKLTEHHKDGNHFNNTRGNRELVHRTCHKAHHTRNNINFWRQFK